MKYFWYIVIICLLSILNSEKLYSQIIPDWDTYKNEEVIVRTYNTAIKGILKDVRNKEVVLYKKNIGDIYIALKEIKEIIPVFKKEKIKTENDTVKYRRKLWNPVPRTCWRYFFTPSAISSEENEIAYINNSIFYNAVHFSFKKHYFITTAISFIDFEEIGLLNIHIGANMPINKILYAGGGFITYFNDLGHFMNIFRATTTLGNNLTNISITGGTGDFDFESWDYLYTLSGQVSPENSFGFIFEFIRGKLTDFDYSVEKQYLIAGLRFSGHHFQFKPVWVFKTEKVKGFTYRNGEKTNNLIMFSLEWIY